jgi:hypothetical protein
MTYCAPQVQDLNRTDRVHIAWDTTGVTDGVDQVYASIEGGPRLPLDIGTNVVTGLFAGPDYPSPAPAHVVTTTSWVDLIVVTPTETLTFPGGFIRLRP